MGYDIFNGDADGICALHMLRMATPAQRTLITGVKRDISLLARVPDAPDPDLLVLDISLDANAVELDRLLANGASITWFDHHAADHAPRHPRLNLHHDDSPAACTSILVDRQQQGRYRPWAVVAAFGDNLAAPAQQLAHSLHISADDCAALAQLGQTLNYNAYGECESDLHIPPTALYQAISACPHPSDMLHTPLYQALHASYRDDCARLHGVQPHWQQHGNAVYLLPDAPWARRANGVLANRLAADDPQASFAVILTRSDGDYLVSIRSGQPEARSACRLCQQFLGGGGRKSAAGINHLPASELTRFIACFEAYFAPGAHYGHAA